VKDENRIWCFYSYMTANIDYGIEEHAQTQMRKLGIKVYKSIPQTIGDGWDFLIDKNTDLPGYIKERES